MAIYRCNAQPLRIGSLVERRIWRTGKRRRRQSRPATPPSSYFSAPSPLVRTSNSHMYCDKYHQQQLTKRCRVCGNLLVSRKLTKSTVYVYRTNHVYTRKLCSTDFNLQRPGHDTPQTLLQFMQHQNATKLQEK